jgi:RNA polymerase sigma-70 factor (ECF subfamily)
MEEREAITQLQRGNIAGLEALVHRYQAQALRAAYLITLDAALAEDVVQTAFLRVYERIHQFDPQRPFGPWFLRSVINTALTTTTSRKRVTSLDQTAEGIVEVASELSATATWDPAVVVERAETRQELHDALKRLTPTQRATIIQRYYLEMSEAEMARHWACAPGTIKWRLHMARAHLRSLLALVWPIPSPSDTKHG